MRFETKLTDYVEGAWGAVGVAILTLGSWAVRNYGRSRAAVEKIQAEQRGSLEKTLIDGVEKIPNQFQAVIAEWQKIIVELRTENAACRDQNRDLVKQIDALRSEVRTLERQVEVLTAQQRKS